MQAAEFPEKFLPFDPTSPCDVPKSKTELQIFQNSADFQTQFSLSK
jgi:hypothetical protein